MGQRGKPACRPRRPNKDLASQAQRSRVKGSPAGAVPHGTEVPFLLGHQVRAPQGGCDLEQGSSLRLEQTPRDWANPLGLVTGCSLLTSLIEAQQQFRLEGAPKQGCFMSKPTPNS